ncbi:transferase, partial [Streptomyces rimosus]
GRRRTAAVLAGLWLGGTAEFAWARIAPGPRTRDEVVTMAVTSALIPPSAAGHWLRGLVRHRRVAPLSVRPAPAVPEALPEPVPERV